MSDQALLQKISEGDRDAFTELYQQYQPMVLRYCGRLLNHDVATAADIVDDVFFDIWQKAGSFQGKSSVKSWIFSIAHHKSVDYIRKNREVLLDDDAPIMSLEDKGETAFESVAVADRQQILVEAMSKLSAEHKEALHLFYYEEMSTKAIASSLSVKETTIRTRLHYAKKAMHNILIGLGASQEVLFNE